MTKKIINLGVFLIMSIGILSGCNYLPTNHNKNNILYDNAIIYDNAKIYIKENVTRGIYYEGQFYFQDESYPKSITHIISDNEAFNKAFKEFPLKIDFNKEILIVFFFSGNVIYTSDGEKLFSYQIQESSLENGVLTIGVKENCLIGPPGLPPPPTGSPPTHQCLVIKIDKIDVESVYIKFV